LEVSGDEKKGCCQKLKEKIKVRLLEELIFGVAINNVVRWLSIPFIIIGTLWAGWSVIRAFSIKTAGLDD